VPYKRRVSKERDGQITNAAVALFERGLRRKARGEPLPQELLSLSCQLAVELHLRPWNDCPLLDCDGDKPPPWVTGDLEVSDWWRSKEIRRQLEAAVAAERAARRKPLPVA
jgi:hypothetical protein